MLPAAFDPGPGYEGLNLDPHSPAFGRIPVGTAYRARAAELAAMDATRAAIVHAAPKAGA